MARFSFKQLYLYGVCAMALLLGIIGVIQFASHVVNLALPDGSSSPPMAVYDKRGLITSFVQIVIAVPLYIYHWRLARATESN